MTRAKNQTYLQEIVWCSLHGANGSAFPKDASYLRVHLDIHTSFLSPLLVSSVDSIVNPLIEDFADEGADDVGNILAR